MHVHDTGNRFGDVAKKPKYGINYGMSSLRLTLLPAIALALATVASFSPATAGKWQTVPASETPVRMIGWPDDPPCSFRDGGYSDGYQTKRTRVFCPDLPFHNGDRTFVHINELQPGYYWQGGISKDVRDLGLFKKSSGDFSFFHKAKFDEGQDFVCYNDSSCVFRNIRFTVEGQACQLAYYLPDLGNKAHSEAPYSIALLDCGTALPFQRKHFKIEGGRITISYPDPARTTSSRVVSDEIVCRMALNGNENAWQELGFGKYVAVARHRRLSVADCQGVLKRSALHQAPKKPPAAEVKSPANSPFAGCFDNPQNCK
ncbi:MAG: hypothetical protein ACI9JL_003685 [Paracoccaceae bacterium]